ncbi:MAG: radical SAM family heme chaperone HemW [Saprospiraceae bacterium]|nr:radical SAM family heme chaperone HemW [Saprospiraceae bacterium]
MAGLYLHIPFCKRACHYCNFHFSTSLKLKEPLLASILREIDLQRDYLGGAELRSIYLGGGTPSLLSVAELETIFQKIYEIFPVKNDLPDFEVTLEANPDDLNEAWLNDLKARTPVNRLSIGIQSFHDDDLKWMNRAHSAEHALTALELAAKTGFHDLTIDLIYGAPTTSDAQWADNLRRFFDFGIPHLSAYCLTVEDGTALGTWVRREQQPPLDEEKAQRQFEYLMSATADAGYEQYEISNFALPGRYARHNSSYWSGEPYLGIGPSAHSFNGQSRQWNKPNNALYIQSLENGQVPFELEVLTRENRYHEYVMTGLRTMWGVDLRRIRAMGNDLESYFLQAVQGHLEKGHIEHSDMFFKLTPASRFRADGISSDLFKLEE